MRKRNIALVLAVLLSWGMLSSCQETEIPDHRLYEPILLETFMYGLYDYETVIAMIEQIHYVRGIGNNPIDCIVVDRHGRDRTEEFIRNTKPHMRKQDYLGMLHYCQENELRIFRKGDYIVTNMKNVIDGIPHREFMVLHADGTKDSTDTFLERTAMYYREQDYSSILEYIETHQLTIIHHRKGATNLDS